MIAFCHDIYRYRPGDRCLWSDARRQGIAAVGRCGQILQIYMLLHIRLRHWSNLSEFSFYIRLSALSHSGNKFRTSKKFHQVKEAGTFFRLKASRHRTMFFCFLIYMPNEKAYPTNQRYYCNSLSCNLLPQLIENSATKGRFFFCKQKTELLFSFTL